MRIFDGAFVLLITCNFSMESLGFWLPIILTSETLCRVYSTASFVNFGAFFNRIADERVGGYFILFIYLVFFKKELISLH